ncbi:ThiF family adenylyltransferase [Leucobacter massiliensis]|uniref:Molybdopterin biosynthesis protein MoeB n=1 Tax=Leucobacter massiliensis TaxID=1686285 RepID=A0A2S9QM55_9MICO|nr:ThiF family adenylyltransferase [Leucobacter massiliensis]PRI10672.1 molybdopterin biosynthesis protein MoeB [Leucobacter massiliensis]
MDPEQRGAPGALVEPCAALSGEQRERALRQIALPGFGELAQRRFAAASVLVIGAGGLGSASVPYLAGAGIGRIGVVDDDRVELSNLHRQIAHGTADVGRPKVASLAGTVAALDPAVRFDALNLRLTAANALEVMRGYDLVIDGSDNFPTRYLVADAAELLGVPLVWGSILQFHGQVGVSWRPEHPGYRDLFPVPPPPEEVLDCGTGGVLPGLCGTVGSLLATEAMKLIAGVGEPLLGRVLVYDALAARTRELPFARDPRAEPVTGLIDYELFCAGPGGPAMPEALDAAELARLMEAGEPPRLIDVRTAEEHAQRFVPGAESVPLDELEAGREIAPGPVVVHCERDPRSIRAARLLQERGHTGVRYLRGGIRALAATAPQLLAGEADTDRATLDGTPARAPRAEEGRR